MFDFITVRNGKKHKKQEEALKILSDNETEELFYGGAAGGAKSWTGCGDLAFKCLAYPETRFFIGRNELKRITESTLITFYKVAKEYKFSHRFKFNAQKNFILFDNGSRIDLLELKYLPSDPLFERFGSTEYTGGWIEEGGEVHVGAYEILKTRIGRHLNDKYNLIAKLFVTLNPKKNWVYTRIYKLFKSKTLPKIIKFLQALVTENPFIESGYIDRLKRTSNKSQKARLLDGDWEYDDDPSRLCEYDDILAIFKNNHVQKGERYITADIARLGSDLAIVLVWDGWSIIDFKVFELSLTTEIQNCIEDFRFKYQIPRHHCIADQDGLGAGVVDNCGIKGFVNNSKPMKESLGEGVTQPNYRNLQVQCGYYLAKMINTHQINFDCEIPERIKERIIEELEQLKSYNSEKDAQKVYLLPKDQIKENIGRSPDWRDVLLMRSFFDLKKDDYFIVG